MIPGLSPSTCHTLNRLDRDELRPDAVAAALRRWQRAARNPSGAPSSRVSATGPLFEPPPRPDVGFERGDWASQDTPMCPVCAAAAQREYEPRAREVLSRALYALPRGKARQLRRLVHRADRQVLNKTLPAPGRPGDEAWWWGRIVTLR